jgi:hypothetical protein
MKLKLTLKPPFILYNDNDTLCECGEYKKCIRKIKTILDVVKLEIRL